MWEGYHHYTNQSMENGHPPEFTDDGKIYGIENVYMNEPGAFGPSYGMQNVHHEQVAPTGPTYSMQYDNYQDSTYPFYDMEMLEKRNHELRDVSSPEASIGFHRPWTPTHLPQQWKCHSGHMTDSFQTDVTTEQELDKMKRERRRERNRQASARYRERKERLLCHLEAETRRMRKEIAELEQRLLRGQQELMFLKNGQPVLGSNERVAAKLIQ